MELSVAAPAPVTERDLLAQVEAVRGALAKREPRAVGDPVGPSDEVCVDVVAYAKGVVVPGLAQFEQWLRLDTPLSHPDIERALKAAKVGQRLEVKTAAATYVIDLKHARALTLPDAGSPEFLAAVGNAKDMADALFKLGEDLAVRRSMQTALTALHVALDTVSRLVEVNVSEALKRQEIHRVWNEGEGASLMSHGVEPEAVAAAFREWSSRPEVVDELVRRIRTTSVVAALVKAHPHTLSPARLAHTAQRWGTFLGLEPSAIREALAAEDWAQNRTADLLMQLSTAEWVLEKAKVSYVQPS